MDAGSTSTYGDDAPLGAVSYRGTGGARAAAKQRLGLLRAERLGVLDRGERHTISKWDDVGPEPGEHDAAVRLRRGWKERALSAHMPGFWDRVGTALTWLERYMKVFPHRVIWVELDNLSDIQPMLYNQESLCDIGEFISSYDKVRGATVGTYLTALRTLRKLITMVDPLGALETVGLTLMLRQMRRDDAPSADRKLERGLRAQMLLRIAATALDRRSEQGEADWGLIVTMWNTLMRGGEPGRVTNQPFSVKRGICLRHIQWLSAAETGDGHRAFILWLVSVKDTHARFKRVPVVVSRRQPEGDTREDPLCAYTYVRRRWERLAARVGTEEMATSDLPFFTQPNGKAVDTKYVSDTVKRFVTTVGEPASEYGGKGPRVGGAQDVRHAMGADDAATLVIKQRGRWASDIALIYARACATGHLMLSRVMGDAAGIDLEALVRGYTMAARGY